jgi:hypothetical protein
VEALKFGQAGHSLSLNLIKLVNEFLIWRSQSLERRFDDDFEKACVYLSDSLVGIIRFCIVLQK